MIDSNFRRVVAIELYQTIGTPPPLYFTKLSAHYDVIYRPVSITSESTRRRLLSSFLLPTTLSKHDVVVSSDYFTSFGTNLRLALTGSAAKHVTIGLNQSRRLLKLRRFEQLNKIINHTFKRTNLIIVHSCKEIDLFANVHDLPIEKFFVSPWGFDLPDIPTTKFSSWRRPYACLVGRNNRDIQTFINALDGSDIDGIVITSAYSDRTFVAPPNIHFFYDLSFGTSLDCIRNSIASTLLLKDSDRGAGHITAVAGMFMRVPQIFSAADVLKEYLVDGVSGIAVPFNDAGAVRRAIDTVLNAPRYSQWIANNAAEYAQRWLTNEASATRVAEAIQKLMLGQNIERFDSEWVKQYQIFSRLTFEQCA